MKQILKAIVIASLILGVCIPIVIAALIAFVWMAENVPLGAAISAAVALFVGLTIIVYEETK